ncbi:MAG: heparinase II/III family protein [bacterium]
MNKQQFLAQAQRLNCAWGDRIPEWNPKTCQEADFAVDGVVVYSCNGEYPTRVGRRYIDWQGTHYADYEWAAQLNRFFFLAALASCYRATGDDKYALAARDYIEDWIQAHPSVHDWKIIGNDNTLNLGIRMGTSQWPGWLGTLPIFLSSKIFDDTFTEYLLESIELQLKFLKQHIPYDGNWRLTSADTLVVSGILLETRPIAEDIRNFGVRVLNDAFRRQIMPDGVHIERNPSYHHWMANVTERFWELGRSMPEIGLVVDTKVVENMFDYSLACMAPDGGWNALHDCQSARNPSYDILFIMQRDRNAFREKAGLPDTLPPLSTYFPNAGQIFMRDSWESTATYLVFDASQWGGAHCHQSRNSISLYISGEAVLVDPGTLTYNFADPIGIHGKSTRAHNTVNINGWNQVGTNPRDTFHHHINGYDMVSSTYDGGYWPGRYLWTFPDGCGSGIQAAHTRTVLWVHDRFIVVIDEIESFHSSSENPTLEINWQFEHGSLFIDESNNSVKTDRIGYNLLMLFPGMPEGVRMSLHEGEMEPPRGWLPSSNGYIKAPQLTQELSMEQMHELSFVTVLIPVSPGMPIPDVEACVSSLTEENSYPKQLTLRWKDNITDEIVWTKGLKRMIDEVDGVITDGTLLHLIHNNDNEIEIAAVFDATFCQKGSYKHHII